ncbi:FG-GAP repeat domain-containing protein [Streptomyces davaonensis JCM 4913]|uniref:FG-GAP repeat domain-containing protein n=1 Tax=Streptomyces davaonensis (strain DSM 101723 / JCM 4913 / KCC S-0913 / 768) TaxID=1214101 RepID=K4R271_STRDJ|nr:trypsin-like serine protease [Streptomyces davaonensis]CCK27433.1 FG-GAP repeat domain-containing protein [Streptomyces davaonensis JCM 4913]
MRIALPVAAAGIAAAIGAALLTSSAGAASASPNPPAVPSSDSPTLAELEQRVLGAAAHDDTAGVSSAKSSYSSSSTVDAKIIGGTTTTITTAPWMAQLWYQDETNGVYFFCGGSVVSPTKILTAAHCVQGYNWKAYGAIVTGTSQLPDGDLNGGTVTAVHRQWNHPSYSSRTIDNDIAVLTLANPIKATPIKMATSTETAAYAAGTSAKVYGWGRTSSTTQDVSETLKTATLPMQSDTTCSGFYGADFVKGHMVCAGNPASGSDSGTTSACNGDSGGPLVVNNRVVGVVSWGVQDCVAKGAYSVFAKVRTYVGAAYPRIDDTNLSLDHKADLWVRNASTKTGYEKDSTGTSFGARESWGNWSAFNFVLQNDLNRDGYQDLLVRRSSDGDVFWKHWVPASGSWATTKVADNWGTRTRIVIPGDLTGDYLPDLVSVDSAGKAWLYPGQGNGTFASRVQIGTGTGWNQYNVLVGHGDFSGDGKADLLARTGSNGYLYLYKGTGKSSAPFSSRVKVRTWSSSTYNKVAVVGDVSGDGKADVLARTPGGTLYLYKGTGKATSEIFATRISVGTDYKQYDIFG